LDCAARRLREELGISGLDLHRAGEIEYRAELDKGLVEHEVVDIFVAQSPLTLPLALNPDEVMETAWVLLPDLARDIQANPERFTPWLRIYLAEGWGKMAQTLTRSPANV
jgi:isopentenyl-diphosphate delta-isomerase